MGSDDFKRMVMCLRTKRAGQIRDYYLAIEKLFKMYCEYTHHYNLRVAKMLVG
ncbi:099L [Cherax quadricarinatus iridovirus]|nr:099L [Cherax quadricarinatus iridovirus]ASZ85079.1 099L [Cherax quadricarinatus iridovirus]